MTANNWFANRLPKATKPTSRLSQSIKPIKFAKIIKDHQRSGKKHMIRSSFSSMEDSPWSCVCFSQPDTPLASTKAALLWWTIRLLFWPHDDHQVWSAEVIVNFCQ